MLDEVFAFKTGTNVMAAFRMNDSIQRHRSEYLRFSISAITADAHVYVGLCLVRINGGEEFVNSEIQCILMHPPIQELSKLWMEDNEPASKTREWLTRKN